jgi:chemotaxis response regulator CheB
LTKNPSPNTMITMMISTIHSNMEDLLGGGIGRTETYPEKRHGETENTVYASGSARRQEGASVSPTQEQRQAFPIVAIGSSAGGLEALRLLFASFPGDTGLDD